MRFFDTYIELILLVVSVYFAARNSRISTPDAPYLPEEDAAGEADNAEPAEMTNAQ